MAKWKKQRTIRQLFMTSSTLILICTVVASFVTWGASLLYLYAGTAGLIQPANYYEQQLPTIYRFVDQRGSALLDPQSKTELEAVIPIEGIDYQVVDLSGTRIYGTIESALIDSPEDLIKQLNTSKGLKGKYVQYYPIMTSDHVLQGAIILRYALNLPAANPDNRLLLVLFTVGNLVAPLVYLTLFTFVFGRKFGRRIEPPITKLIESANRIEQQDLDFTMGHISGTKELSELGRAFEQMRRTLHDTLIRKWRSDQEHRDMVAAIAHDLRTPLTIIQGHVEGLIDGGVQHPQRLKRYLHTIDLNTGRTIRLLEQMVTLSEVDSPEFTLSPKAVNVATFVRQKDDEFTVLCQKHQIAFHSTYRDMRHKPEPVQLDVDQLGRVLDNLIANSLQFTPKHGFITMDTRVREGGVEFNIKDSGPGFTQTDLKMLFQKFYRGDPARSTGKGHAGLGLYIARTIVRKHGGDMTVSNTPEGGAHIHLWVSGL